MSLNIDLIRASFEKARPVADQVADKFYDNLWGDFPASKGLFTNVDMPKQKNALIASLVYIVDHLDQGEKLQNYLQRMGERHVSYGTKKEHYDWVGASLLKTLKHFLGSDWNPELEKQWKMAYGHIAEQMLIGAKNHSPELKDIKKYAREVCNNLLKDILEQGFDKEFETYVRARIRKILFQVLEEEAKELIRKKVA